MATRSITVGQLTQLLADSEPRPAVIDVLTPEAFAEQHVDGARNICVYETAFLPKVQAEFPDRETFIVTCGQSDATREAEVAAEKLAAAGYTRVQWLAGGLEEWIRAGGRTVRGEVAPESLDTCELKVDPERSVLIWTGRNLFNHHCGTIRVANGSITVKEGVFVSGRITIDMNSIACDDIKDRAMNAMLIHHLRDDDFFAVDRFPTAEFVFTRVQPLADARPGVPNFQISGDFTLRGVTRPVSFPASIARRHDGTYTAQAFLEIDRTDWGVLYGSSKFFAKLSEHVVNDDIHLHLKISAKG